MIELHFGNIGSGKTLSVVREIVENKEHATWFTNIQMPNIKHNIELKRDMIMIKEIGDKGKVTYKVNVKFWQDAIKKYGKINVVIDEAHTIFNSRKAMSKQNIIMSEFLALLRRVIGGTGQYGKLILISQLPRRVDVISREMATKVIWHVAHYHLECAKCHNTFYENNESSEKILWCPQCQNPHLKQSNTRIEVYHFRDMQKFDLFANFGMKTYHMHFLINDGEQYFKYYNTLQWDNLISEE